MKKSFGALRGVAMLLVLLNHSARMMIWFAEKNQFPHVHAWELVTLNVIEQLGIFAVPAFLFISGCFFSYALQFNTSTKYPFRVIWSNINHLLFPYLIWSVLYYLAIYSFFGESHSLADYIKYLIVGYPFNFIPLLIAFYIAAPFIVRIERSMGFYLLALVGLYQLLLINLNNPGILGFQFPAWLSILELPVLGDTFTLWGVYFPLGIYFSRNIREMDKVLVKYKWAFLSLAVILFLSFIIRSFVFKATSIEAYLSPLFLVLLLPTIKREQIPQPQFFETAGKWSLGLYLMNLTLILLILYSVNILAPWLMFSQLLFFVLLFGASLLPLYLLQLLARRRNRGYVKYIFG